MSAEHEKDVSVAMRVAGCWVQVHTQAGPSGGLMIIGMSLDVASAYAALSEEFTADADTVRVLGTAGNVVALTGLIGGGVLVAVTARIAQRARALPAWAVWASYVVAGLCVTGFWSEGMASLAFAVWLFGPVVGLLRAARSG